MLGDRPIHLQFNGISLTVMWPCDARHAAVQECGHIVCKRDCPANELYEEPGDGAATITSAL